MKYLQCVIAPTEEDHLFKVLECVDMNILALMCFIYFMTKTRFLTDIQMKCLIRADVNMSNDCLKVMGYSLYGQEMHIKFSNAI